MSNKQPHPDYDHLSALLALIMLSYSLVRVINLPTLILETTLFGLLLQFEVNAHLIMISLAGALAAAGSNWILRFHPNLSEDPLPYEYLIVPGMAALAAGAIIIQLPLGWPLVIGLITAAVFLYFTIHGEYILVDPEDRRYPFAAVSIRLLSTLLLIGALFVITASNARTLYAIPLTFLAASLVALRWLRLNLRRASTWLYAATIGWLTAQIHWGLHYLPISPLRASLILGLLTYSASGLMTAYIQRLEDRAYWFEHGILFVVALMAILFLP